MNQVLQTKVLLLALFIHYIHSPLYAYDWPQFRYDAGRSAASPETLPQRLHLHWVRHLPQPQPAFPLEVRLRFDVSYEPVVLGKTMFVPSMVTDSVTALDTATGQVRWQFFCDGPVRFAPVAAAGNVYAASDDGFLYCLDAENGKLMWKFRGLPKDRTDRKLLGNKRLISLWPARGGPVLFDGAVYFAAGLWPSDGVFIHALDARTGVAIWSNTTSHHIPEANMDHGIAQIAGLTPQGYLAMVGDKLIVPCGAQLPAFLDPKTGALGQYMMGWGGREGLPKGSWFVAGAGRFLSHSGDLYDLSRPNDETFSDPRGRPDFKRMLYPGGYTRLLIDTSNQRALGAFDQPIISEDSLYFYDNLEQAIVAHDLTSYTLEERSKIKPTEFRDQDRYPDKWQAGFRRLWTLPTDLNVHIKAGPRLYIGGPGVVQAIEADGPNTEPKVTWEMPIEGHPSRMLAADGKLFVVTDEGRIYAFGEPKLAGAVTHREIPSASSMDDQSTRNAAQIIQATGVKDGYALVLGIDNGRLIEELIRQSNLTVIAVDRDETRIARLRTAFHRDGLYGTRVLLHVGDPLEYPFPPYLANLIVSENIGRLGNSFDQSAAKMLIHHLRPYGGTVYLAPPDDMPKQFLAVLSAEKDAGSVLRQTNEYVLLVRQGALPAAADWSHAGANAANTAASQDRFLRPPLGLLWFDSSMRWHRKPGSAEVRVAGGRVFVFAEALYAIDVYTGRRLWEVEMPFVTSSNTEMVAAGDRIFLASGSQCQVLEAATGRTVGKVSIPVGTPGDWANLRVQDDYLLATLGKTLVCIRHASNEMLWKFECQRAALSMAVGPDRVFCAELINARRGETAEKADLKIRAFDLQTGQPLWEAIDGSDIHYSEAQDLLVTASGVYRGSDGSRLRAGVAAPQIVGERIVSGTADKFSMYNLVTGDKTADELQWNRRGCTEIRSSCHLVTTRFKANAAYVDLQTQTITPLWNIRPGCRNNLFPANGILNVPNVTGGCECNYTPTSKAFAPLAAID